MSLWKIAWRSIQQRALASALTGVSMALGVALVVTVLVIHSVVQRQFTEDAQGYDLIIGAKGGKLQLVLNTVYHLDQPIENIPYSYYKEFTEGEFAPWTKVAVPYCLGDSYHAGKRAFRVVGTTSALFEKLHYGNNLDGTPKTYTFEEGGRNFKDENFFEAVLGSVVARQSGLHVGDTFQPSHGIDSETEGHKHDAFRVVGILQPTGTANDRALFVNLEGFYLLSGHAKAPVEEEGASESGHSGHEENDSANSAHEAHDDHSHDQHEENHEHQHDANHEHEEAHGHEEDHEHEHGHEEEHDHEHDGEHHEPLSEAQREVTAILVLADNIMYPQTIFTKVNEGQVAQAVYPTREVTILLERFVGPIQLVLLVLTVLIVVVASISILVSIYNSMSERSHEIAVMRALGASRGKVMTIILLESILLALVSGAAGILLGHGALGAISPYVASQTGITLHALQFDAQELNLIPALVILATIVGFLPAMTAYRTDVAKSLGSVP